VITSVRRLRWSAQEKAAIVQETLGDVIEGKLFMRGRQLRG
jgi:hypothetical protein